MTTKALKPIRPITIDLAIAKLVPLLETQQIQVSTKTLAELAKVSTRVALAALHRLHDANHTRKSGGQLYFCEDDAGSRGGHGCRGTGPAKYYWFFQ